MMSNKITIGLRWGCLCEPISEQLKQQGIEFDEEDGEYFNRLKDACNLLSFIVPDSTCRKNFEKANKEVLKRIQLHYKNKKGEC